MKHSIAEAAIKLNVSEEFIEKLIKANALPESLDSEAIEKLRLKHLERSEASINELAKLTIQYKMGYGQ